MINQKQLYKRDLQKINFWKRLELFMVNVNVCDPMSQEEKEMILNVCKQEQEKVTTVQPDVIKSVCGCKEQKQVSYHECCGSECINIKNIEH